MTETHLDQVWVVAGQVHPDYPEERAVFAERCRLHPEGCLVLDQGAGLGGYVLSHPWHAHCPPKLDTLLGRLPAAADTYYLHDLALLPGARGQGHAGAMVEHLAGHARRLGLTSLTLIAVNHSGAFWQRQGFAVVTSPGAAAILASYGADAALMQRRLG